jgi:peptidoglycan/LPS O-acetylase OafA/YrhL
LPAPIVDAQRWGGFDLLAIFNDTFFMALMFLLSGLFVWPSLKRKGGARFLRDRILRLGLPFAVAAGILMPLAYYPSYAVTGADPGFAAYARAWLSLGFWPSGPAWFISLLFVFDAVAAVVYILWRRWTANRQGPQHLGLYGRPAAFVAMLLAVSALVYVPMELNFGALRWLAFGPFLFQASRPLLYATYFLAGLQLGAFGTESNFLAHNGELARRWRIWLSAGLAAYVLQLGVIAMLVLPVNRDHLPLPLAARLLNDFTFVLCCGTISFAFIVIFRRFAVARRPIFDNLSASSYGMYLVHYPVVVWLQFAMLAISLSPIAKASIVYTGAVAQSWAIVVALRRAPVIARVL